MRYLRSILTFAAAMGVVSVAAVAHDEKEHVNDGALEMMIHADDGVASLPVFMGPFPETENMEFLGQISPDDLGALPVPGVWAKGMMNDVWGWTSPAGEEYALATNSGGIAIVRVTDPTNPVFLGRIQSQLPFNFANIWGDPATFSHYGYFVTEIGESAVVIVDLSGLDALGAAPSSDTELPAPAFFWKGGGYNGSHNVIINEATGHAYLAGAHVIADAAENICDTPARFNTLILDLKADPTDPTVVACVADAGEHDIAVINYAGPDAEHQGKEIAFVFDGRDHDNPTRGGFRDDSTPGVIVGGMTEIWDVTDKNNIVVLASFQVPGLVFSHNGRTTAEQDFLFIGDEIEELVLAGWSASFVFAQPVDEPTNMPQTGTFIVDINDLDNPLFVERFTDGTVGLDHNFVVRGDKLYVASYTSGTRVFRITRDADNVAGLAPIAVMDTEPRLPGEILNINQEERFGNAFLGQWGIYAFPDSDTVIATDLNNGLVMMRLSDAPCSGIRCSR